VSPVHIASQRRRETTEAARQARERGRGELLMSDGDPRMSHVHRNRHTAIDRDRQVGRGRGGASGGSGRESNGRAGGWVGGSRKTIYSPE
jgi:hypothetical protein